MGKVSRRQRGRALALPQVPEVVALRRQLAEALDRIGELEQFRQWERDLFAVSEDILSGDQKITLWVLKCECDKAAKLGMKGVSIELTEEEARQFAEEEVCACAACGHAGTLQVEVEHEYSCRDCGNVWTESG